MYRAGKGRTNVQERNKKREPERKHTEPPEPKVQQQPCNNQDTNVRSKSAAFCLRSAQSARMTHASAEIGGRLQQVRTAEAADVAYEFVTLGTARKGTPSYEHEWRQQRLARIACRHGMRGAGRKYECLTVSGITVGRVRGRLAGGELTCLCIKAVNRTGRNFRQKS